jgi:hypothetical protein
VAIMMATVGYDAEMEAAVAEATEVVAAVATADMRGRMDDPAVVAQFLYAGNATVTLLNTVTGVRFTFNVVAPRDKVTGEYQTGAGLYWVKLLNGPENVADYTYMGTVVPAKIEPKVVGTGLRATKGSKVAADAPSFKAADWMLRLLASGMPMPAGLEVWHEGKCGKCGRRLTVPESVAAGIGPVCRKNMGI